MGSVDGHALITGGTIHKKYDGTTVRNWGIATPLEAPTVGSTALSSLTIANFSLASAEFAADEGVIAYQTGQDGVANGATGITPAIGTGRAEMTYNFASVRNLLDFSGSEGGSFDLFEFWFYDLQPVKTLSLEILFGLDTGTNHFQENAYSYQFGSGLEPIGLTRPEIRIAQQESVAKAEEPAPKEPGPEGGGEDPIKDDVPKGPSHPKREGPIES